MNKKTLNKILIVSMILVIFLPFLLTRSLGWIYFDANSAYVGETIGGLTSPLINLIGAFLIYFTLRNQIESNEKIQSQINRQKITEKTNLKVNEIEHLFDFLNRSIDNFSFSPLDGPGLNNSKSYKNLLKGSSAIQEMLRHLKVLNDLGELRKKYYVNEFISILDIIDLIIDKSYKVTRGDSRTFLLMTQHIFKYKIQPEMGQLKLKNHKVDICEICEKKHGYPKQIRVRICTILDKFELINKNPFG